MPSAMSEGATLPFQLLMNTHQLKDNESGRDAYQSMRTRPEARLVSKNGGIHLELVMPTDKQQDRSEAHHEITQ